MEKNVYSTQHIKACQNRFHLYITEVIEAGFILRKLIMYEIYVVSYIKYLYISSN